MISLVEKIIIQYCDFLLFSVNFQICQLGSRQIDHLFSKKLGISKFSDTEIRMGTRDLYYFVICIML